MAWKDLLVKAKLIEPEVDASAPKVVSPHSLKDELAELDLPGEPATSPTPVDGEAPSIVEGAPLDGIYSSFGVPPASFPAERLLKVLDGLRAMDAANQRAAVAAMDAADDSWSLDEVLADAASKVAALNAHLGTLSNTVAAVRAKEQEERAALAKEYEALCTSINQQIAELQEALRLATADNVSAIQGLENRTRDAASASQREQLRIQSEIDRLGALQQQFAPTQNQ